MGHGLNAWKYGFLPPNLQCLDGPLLVSLFKIVEHRTVPAKSSLQEHLDRTRGPNRPGVLAFHHRERVRELLEVLVDLLDEFDDADRRIDSRNTLGLQSPDRCVAN